MSASFQTQTLASVEVSDKTLIYPPEQAEQVIGREDQVMAAIGLYGVGKLVEKSLPLPTQVVIGRFSAADYDSFFKNQTYGIALWPLPVSQMIENYHPAWRSYPRVVPSLTASAPGKIITFGGSVSAGINVAVLTGNRQAANVIGTTANDTPETVAAAVAAVLVDLGITATASGTVVRASDVVTVRIGAPGSMWREASKIQQHIQISVWSGVKLLRGQIGDALRSVIGTIANPRINVDSLSDVWVKYVGSRRMDDDEIDSLWVYHLIVSAQYAIIETQDAYPILTINTTISVNGAPSLTLHD